VTDDSKMFVFLLTVMWLMIQKCLCFYWLLCDRWLKDICVSTDCHYTAVHCTCYWLLYDDRMNLLLSASKSCTRAVRTLVSSTFLCTFAVHTSVQFLFCTLAVHTFVSFLLGVIIIIIMNVSRTSDVVDISVFLSLMHYAPMYNTYT